MIGVALGVLLVLIAGVLGLAWSRRQYNLDGSRESLQLSLARFLPGLH